jgi:hypothetical protein
MIEPTLALLAAFGAPLTPARTALAVFRLLIVMYALGIGT